VNACAHRGLAGELVSPALIMVDVVSECYVARRAISSPLLRFFV